MPSRLPRLIRKLWRSFQALIQAISALFLRSLFLPIKKKAGFVLPTATLVLLVVSLLVGTLVIRTGQEAEEAIGQQAQQEIYNVATPAVDRAKAKIEALFNDDDFPNSPPSERYLNSMMLNDGNVAPSETEDPYTLNGETRLDLDEDNVDDNAWQYQIDADGDGNTETTVRYSITMLTEEQNSNTDINSTNQQKANNLVVRSGPLNSQSGGSAGNCQNLNANLARFQFADGWYPITGATLRKNFQINAVVENNNEVNKAVTALEVQQDRDLDAGNQWGAWFRYDLEFTPGSNFDWNGAMHTEGSLLFNNNGGNTTRFRLISSPASCLYSRDASRITMADAQTPLFQGQLMRANTDDDIFVTGNGNQVVMDIFPDDPSQAPTGDNRDVELPSSKDSVDPGSGESPSLFMLDAVELATTGNSQARNSSDVSNIAVRDDDYWSSDENKIRDRIYNDDARQPFVDDTYRADDRWGPKPKYDNRDDFALDATDDKGNGDPITDTQDPDGKLTNTPNNANALPTDPGLDGYWERRAFMEGMRIIVGQRLELGNPEGWQGSSDRLYNLTPQNIDLFDNTDLANTENQNTNYNRAAVQSAAVYHWDENRDEPVACLAMTGHPGLAGSTQFDTINIGGADFLDINFFRGEGTNGWEFPFPGNFAADIDDAGSTLRQTLQNLAQFAGDPEGAFPPTQENGGSQVHPDPELAMWGNFSNLRRAIDQLDDGDDYDDLSLADQTTIQTATCTLGMLAYNIQVQEEIRLALQEELEDEASEVNFGEAIVQAIEGPKEIYSYITNDDIVNDNSQENDILERPSGEDDSHCAPSITDCIRTPQQYVDDLYDASGSDPSPSQLSEYFSLFTQEQWFDAYEEAPGGGNVDRERLEEFVEDLENYINLFQILRDRQLGFKSGGFVLDGDSGWDSDTQQPSNSDYFLQDAESRVEFPPQTSCDPDLFEPFVVGGGVGLKPKLMGIALSNCEPQAELEPVYPSLFYLFPTTDHDHNGDPTNDNDQPPLESYIADTYIFDDSASGTPTGVNGGVTYQEITDADITSLALTPTDSSSFVLPTDGGGSNQITLPDGTNLFVPFLDRAISDGREEMDVRVLDIDLDLLRSNQTTNDFWLPTGGNNREAGVVYAFREDALREDAIQRPRNESWSNCNTESLLTGIDITGGDGKALSGSASDSCRMLPGTPQDPPLNTDTDISAKAIDSYEDPARRPYGFRLRNGADVSRNNTDGTGLSFITDQPVYIQGDFNVHGREEFTDSGSAFYERSELDEQFATPGGETWRATEIIADSITLLSANFDGDIADPLNNPPGPSGDIEVNSILVSALIPSLPRKYNGGIHNFPRFLENWGGTVTIRGALIQLNFSQYATGAYDKENQDPTLPSDLSTGVNIPYYSAPTRNWGYDVGLQLTGPGPVAERFITPSGARTETYRELSVDDDYIQNLLNAPDPNN